MTAQKRALDKIYKRRDRYEIPDWQREHVWDRTKQQGLIDSVLRGWKLPKFYFLKTSGNPDEFEVLDGQQRLGAIFDFFDNELPLSEESAAKFGARYYRSLPTAIADSFDDFEIEYDQIEEGAEKDQKEFFQRLQAGLPLTSSEKLNSVHSDLRNFAKQLAKHQFFTEKVAASNKRYGHFDIVCKVAALAIEGLGAGLRYDDLKATFESQGSFSSKSNTARRLRETFDYLNRMFPSKNPTVLKNRTIIQSFATLVYRLTETQRAQGRESEMCDFCTSFVGELTTQVELGQDATDRDYIQFQKTVNANVRGGAQIRQEILLRKLLLHNPGFADVFDPAAIAESGIRGQITRLGESIARQIGAINSAYAGTNGCDLFKSTNKTAQALTRLGKPISSQADYQRLIDDLYFLLHEGVGTRLDPTKPASFKEVNDLRTELRHDLDHGTKSKVAAKRKKVSSSFAKYAGAPSPSTISPDRFPLVQARLLQAIDRDLASLAARFAGSSP
jgi:Protein of unknown function DUF262